MNEYIIRYNQTKGQPGRGTVDHVWRVFENGQEYLLKNFKLNVPSTSHTDGNNWNVQCFGYMTLDRDTSTAIINDKQHV